MSDAVSTLTAKRKLFHAPKLMTRLQSKEAIYHATMEEPNAASQQNQHSHQTSSNGDGDILSNILANYNLPSQGYEVLLVNHGLLVEV
jgi:hypothetical protein